MARQWPDSPRQSPDSTDSSSLTVPDSSDSQPARAQISGIGEGIWIGISIGVSGGIGDGSAGDRSGGIDIGGIDYGSGDLGGDLSGYESGDSLLGIGGYGSDLDSFLGLSGNPSGYGSDASLDMDLDDDL